MDDQSNLSNFLNEISVCVCVCMHASYTLKKNDKRTDKVSSPQDLLRFDQCFSAKLNLLLFFCRNNACPKMICATP